MCKEAMSFTALNEKFHIEYYEDRLPEIMDSKGVPVCDSVLDDIIKESKTVEAERGARSFYNTPFWDVNRIGGPWIEEPE